MIEYVTVEEAAIALKCSTSAIRHYCQKGLLSAEKPGRDWLIEIDSIVEFQPPKTGRPRKRMNDEQAAQSRASVAVHNAIKRGHLVPKSCEICDQPNTEAHHADYEKPLEVRWLCRRHHRYLHLGRLELSRHDNS